MNLKKAATLLAALFFCLCLTACNIFVGNSLGGERAWTIEYTVFSGTEAKPFALQQGDCIVAEVAADGGELDIAVQQGDDEPIYLQENVSTGTLQIPIEEDGTYKMILTGRKAKGGIQVQITAQQPAVTTIKDGK